MATCCREKRYKPRGGDPYPAPEVSLKQRVMLAPLGALLRVVALLPGPLRCGCADVLAFIAGKVVRYRRHIVRRNIADCFPESSLQWRRSVEKGFYRNLADYFFQTLDIAYGSERKLMRHITFSGLDILRATLAEGKNIVLYTSHFGNWEYIPLLALYMPERSDVVYAHVNRPLKNLWFNRFFHRLRSRFNTSVPMRQTARAMIGWQRDSVPYMMGFLSDQKPGLYTPSVTVDFLGRATPFIAGAEELARKLHTAVYYTDVRRTGRDRFHVALIKLSEDAAATTPGELTARYAELLTATIRRDPASYLWSHNRWRLPKT